MRISTSLMHDSAVSSMSQQQAMLSKTQIEVSSGLKVQEPSDDPVAAVAILRLQQAKASYDQFGTNIDFANVQLGQEDQVLGEVTNLVQRVSQFAIQANNDTLTDQDRQSMVVELTEINKQLLSLANTEDSNGVYLFSGFTVGVQPFSRDSSNAVVYSGSSPVRNVQITSAQDMSIGNSGDDVFMSIPEGNGTFVLGATATNTGTGVMTGAVQDITNWVPDNYTLTFTTPTDWQITDGSAPPNTVSSGTGYVSGTTIQFNGVSVTLNGDPAAGDSFTINASGTENVFSTIDQFIAELSSSHTTTSQRAMFQNNINKVLQQLTQAESNMLRVRASVGARMSTLENVEAIRQDEVYANAKAMSKLRDVDYADAVSRLSQQTLGLQAAQQSYIKIAQLSMFNYL